MNKFLKVLGVFAFASVLFSCDKEEDVADIVQVHKPNMTINIASNINAQEGDIVPFTLNFDEPVGREFHFYVVRLNQSSASGVDSSVSESYSNTAFQQTFVVPAGATSFTGEIVIEEDIDNDDNEQLVLTVGDTRTSAVLFTPSIVTINIDNVVKDELTLDFHFNKDFGVAAYSSSLCEFESELSGNGYDIDFIFYDASYNDLSVFDAQTGACEESLSMNLADYADGVYHITSFLYTNGELDLASLSFPLLGLAEFEIPVTVDYYRSGSFKGLYAQDAADRFTSMTPEGTESYVMSVEVYTDVDGQRKFKVFNDNTGAISGMGKHVKVNKKK